MQPQNLVGPGGHLADGQLSTTGDRVGRDNDHIMSILNPDEYEWALRGNMFRLANQAAVTTTAGLATTFTGLSVANPIGSGVNLVMIRFSVAQIAVAVAGGVGYMSGTGASAGALVPRNCFQGSGGVSKAIGSAGSTLGGTPVIEELVGSVGSLATTGYGLQIGLTAPMNNLLIPPGNFVASYTTAACTSAFVFTYTWVEIPTP